MQERYSNKKINKLSVISSLFIHLLIKYHNLKILKSNRHIIKQDN